MHVDLVLVPVHGDDPRVLRVVVCQTLIFVISGHPRIGIGRAAVDDGGVVLVPGWWDVGGGLFSLKKTPRE